jgi:tRNA(Arg) A34 adenosine deaminase TadA
MSRYYPREVIDPYQDYQYEVYEHISNNDQKFLSVATKLALTSDNRFRIGAIVVKSRRVLGGSANITRQSPSTPPNRFSIHAEIAALRVASFTDKAILYVARLSSNDQTAMARPCSWCMQKITEAGIDKVVYTTGIDTAQSFYTSTVKWSKNV